MPKPGEPIELECLKCGGDIEGRTGEHAWPYHYDLEECVRSLRELSMNTLILLGRVTIAATRTAEQLGELTQSVRDLVVEVKRISEEARNAMHRSDEEDTWEGV